MRHTIIQIVSEPDSDIDAYRIDLWTSVHVDPPGAQEIAEAIGEYVLNKTQRAHLVRAVVEPQINGVWCVWRGDLLEPMASELSATWIATTRRDDL